MNCNELKRRVKYGQPQQRTTLQVMREHAAGCADCRQLLAAESLAEALLNARKTDDFDPSPFWASKLKRRIEEMRDQGVHSWEAYLMGLRGWLTALGAAAMLLLAMSVGWRSVNVASQPETDLEEAGLHASLDELISSGPESGHKPSNLYE